MIVKLNAADEFGPDGPNLGALGRAFDIRRMPDGDVMLLCSFAGFPDADYWVMLDQILWPNTSETETFYSSLEGVR